MRLTLRTLLAYLDDILEPTQAKEIGEKIHDSTFATSLVNKIQDVVRRRRISAPEPSGPGSAPDPNIVAEYLDNTLKGDAVADLERICLESDAHLAEVAACHQILTLVHAESVEIPTELREHMYAQGAIAPSLESLSDNGQASHVTKVLGVGAADVVRKIDPGSAEFDLEQQVPAELVNRPRWRTTALYVACAAIFALWVFVTVTDTTLTQPFIAQDDGETVGARRLRVPVAEDANGGVVADTPPPDPTQEDDVNGADASAEDKSGIAVAQTTPPEPSEPMTSQSDEPDTEVDPSGSTAVVEMPPDAPPPQPVEPEPKPEPEPVLPKPYDVQYVSTSGVVLRHHQVEDQWKLLARRSLLFAGDEVACPEPFTARFTISDKSLNCEVQLLGGTCVRSLGSSVNSRFGWEIEQGRLILTNQADEAESASVSLMLKIRQDEWLLELLEPETVVGIEVIPIGPNGVGDMSGATAYSGRLQLQNGSARLTELPSGRAIELQPSLPLLAFPMPKGDDPAEPQVAATVPDWLMTGGVSDKIVQRLAGRYEKEFVVEQPISQSIRPVVQNQQPRISELASETLALTGRLDGLVDALSASHEETRVAAIEGIRAWLPRAEEHGSQLKVELQNRFRPDVAEALNRLLWGYTELDAKNEFTSTELVDWMGHDEVAVRELAAYSVHRLTDRSFGYQADRRADEREAIVKRWRQHIKKTGALVSQ